MPLFLLLALFLHPQERPPDKCSLSGTVVDSVTGDALGKVNLSLEPLRREDTPSATTTTDAKGHFTLVDLDPGRYYFRGWRSGYLMMYYGARKQGLDGTVVQLDAGQSVSDIAFKLIPAGVIAGTVHDSDGEIIEGASINLASLRYVNGKPTVVGDSTDVRTDDRGEYRITQLSAGKYYVGVVPESSGGWDSVERSPNMGPTETAVPTYYPGVPSIAMAYPIELSPGKRVTGIDVTLLRSRVVCVGGRVTNLPAGLHPNIILSEKGMAAETGYGLATAVKNAAGDFQILSRSDRLVRVENFRRFPLGAASGRGGSERRQWAAAGSRAGR